MKSLNLYIDITTYINPQFSYTKHVHQAQLPQQIYH